MYHSGETEPMLAGARSPAIDKPGGTNSGSIRTMRLEQSERKCNDVFFAILFVAHVITIAVFAFWKGIPVVIESVNNMDDDDEPQTVDGDFTKVYGLGVGLMSIGVLFSVFWMRFLMAYATQLIRVALWLNVGLLIGFGVSSFSVSAFVPFIFFGLAALNVCFIFAVRNRIAFATANLKTACAAINAHLSIFWVALFMIVKQFAWLLLWTLSAIGIYQHFKEIDPQCASHVGDAPVNGTDTSSHHLCGGTTAGVTLFCLLISLYWAQQVMQNVLRCTTAGVVASWWYQPNTEKITFNAFYRSLTTSFGSICFGSLIVAILQALETMARIIQEKASEEQNAVLACVACVAQCLLNCIENIIEYFNSWAYVYVGVYGYDFRTSGKAVMDLFANRGWTAIINDELTSSALTVGAFGVGCITAIIGLIMVKYSPAAWFEGIGSTNSAYGVFATVGFATGFGMAMILANVIATALHTVFVCFAEDPIAFSRNHPHEYESLVTAWREFQGDALTLAYGTNV